MHKVYGKDIREIVAQKEWQDLRSSLVGTWKRTPDDNVRKLSEYLDSQKWDRYAVVRVLNYLTGTAFRIGAINTPRIESLRASVRAMHDVFKEQS